MMKKLLLSLLFAGLTSSGLQAIYADSCEAKSPRDCFSLYAAGGGSFTRCVDMCVSTSDGSYWQEVPEGYDSDLGKTGFIEYGLGYEWCNWLSFMATGQYRNTMNYSIQQTEIPVLTFLENGTEMIISDTGCRFFDLDATTFMFSALFDLTNLCGCEDWALGVLIGGGVGFTHFDLFNFHLKLDSEVIEIDPAFLPPITLPTRVRDTMFSTSNNCFAAQAMIGLQYTTCDWFKIGVGYRFFHGGHFCTNDFVTNSRSAEGNDLTHVVDPWQGRLQANEVYLNLYCSY